jgi:hypothetical protein
MNIEWEGVVITKDGHEIPCKLFSEDEGKLITFLGDRKDDLGNIIWTKCDSDYYLHKAVIQLINSLKDKLNRKGKAGRKPVQDNYQTVGKIVTLPEVPLIFDLHPNAIGATIKLSFRDFSELTFGLPIIVSHVGSEGGIPQTVVRKEYILKNVLDTKHIKQLAEGNFVGTIRQQILM